MGIRLVLINVILVIITSVTTVFASDCWNALARNVETREIIIRTGPTQQAAVALAKKDAGYGPDAVVWAWGYKGCLAIAVDADNDEIFGVSSRRTLKEAVKESLKICKKATGKKCEIKKSHCCPELYPYGREVK